MLHSQSHARGLSPPHPLASPHLWACWNQRRRGHLDPPVGLDPSLVPAAQKFIDGMPPAHLRAPASGERFEVPEKAYEKTAELYTETVGTVYRNWGDTYQLPRTTLEARLR